MLAGKLEATASLPRHLGVERLDEFPERLKGAHREFVLAVQMRQERFDPDWLIKSVLPSSLVSARVISDNAPDQPLLEVRRR